MHLSAKREVSGMLSHQCYPFLITLSDCEAHWSFNVFRYGRYRPWGIPISKRPLGWQMTRNEMEKVNDRLSADT